MPSPFDALLAIIGSTQAAKSSLSQSAAASAHDPTYETGIPEAYTAPSVGDLPMAGVINPVTKGAHAQWPKLAKLIADKLDEAAGLGMGHRALTFLEKHPRTTDIYDTYKGPERGIIDIPSYPRLPLAVKYKSGDIDAAGHEFGGHALSVLAGKANEAPPGLAPTLSGHLDRLLGRVAGHYSAAELPGELYPNLFNDLTKVTDKPAFAKWLWDATDLANAPHVKWGEAPKTLKKVWEGNAFYETMPGQGFSWKVGDLTDPALKAKTVPKEFTGFFNPETNFGGYGIDLPNQPLSPDLFHFELLGRIRDKLRGAADFDRPIQDLIDLERHAKVRVAPGANAMYGAPSGPNDFTLIPRFRQVDLSNELAKRRAGNQTQREVDDVMTSLRNLNLIQPGQQPTYVSHYYPEHTGLY